MTEAFRGILHPGLRKGVGGLLLSPCMDRDGIADVLDSLMLMTRSYEEEDASLYSGIGGLLAGCLAAAARIGDGEEKEMLSHLIRRLSRLLIPRVESAGQVSGLGRGMAGTGLALVQAWQHTGDRELLEAAEKAFSLESGQYRELLRGWPDYGKSPLPVIVGESLEAGAPGIALAAVLSEQAVPAAGELADRALSCTLALPFQETDDLALGNAGIALALTEAACRRSDPGLLRAAGERLAQSAQRANQDGGSGRRIPIGPAQAAQHSGSFLLARHRRNRVCHAEIRGSLRESTEPASLTGCHSKITATPGSPSQHQAEKTAFPGCGVTARERSFLHFYCQTPFRPKDSFRLPSRHLSALPPLSALSPSSMRRCGASFHAGA